MASNFDSSIHGGSDLFFDFSCLACQENDRNTEAEFYCEECSKLFCGTCVKLHDTLFKKHATLGKGNINQWPDTNVDALEQCQEHKKQQLTGFCEDHNQLICHVCHIYNHQTCSHVVLIADKVKDLHQQGDFKKLSATLDTLNVQLIQNKDDFEESMKSLEQSYNTILDKINALRQNINASLDELEKNTIKELDTLLATMKMSIETDIEKCTESIKHMTCVQEDWLRIKDKSEAVNFIMYTKCLDQSLKTKTVLQEMTTTNERTFTFNPNTTIQQTLSMLTGLGQIVNKMKHTQTAKIIAQNTETRQEKPNPCSTVAIKHCQTRDVTKPSVRCDPNQVIRVESNSIKMYLVKVKTDKKTSVISGICGTATGELLITDYDNNSVKLLNQTYKVVDVCHLPDKPCSMCSIDSSLVAVTLENWEVHFIRVTNDQLVKDRILKLQHECYGIAYHQSNLYITDSSALYRYTVDGRLVSKMYKVMACAVSPDGERIYVANNIRNQLVTLSRDGTVISTFTDPLLDWGLFDVRPGLHVTDSGQVLVCGGLSNKIIQVDRDGRQRLAEVIIQTNGVFHPRCVYYSKLTGTIIVGIHYESIMVFKAQ
ncbi:uncharacterized protein LOC127858625 isoform X2 [Dreissena polymorpha]|uniref:uncharacterized protein LOC127858625 isoform X2 n=1 Tax=Dreissena polymorpha TaxID=45954 RepID=UPI00226440B6|nr:uncharacterized protein LOC127858625 isoform X2 [Dreissena polymorpha]